MIRENNDWISPQEMDSHQQRKHRRIRAIANVIERRGRVNYKKFLAEMQYHGLRKCVAEEYLDVLKDLGWLKCENEEIIWKGKLSDESEAESNEKGRRDGYQRSFDEIRSSNLKSYKRKTNIIKWGCDIEFLSYGSALKLEETESILRN